MHVDGQAKSEELDPRPIMSDRQIDVMRASCPSLEERLRDRLGFTTEDAPSWLQNPKPPGKLKPGFVAQELTMKDRNLVIGACRAYCQRKGEKRIENHQFLERLNRILAFDETLEFYAMIGDVKDQMTREWNGQRMRYNRWRDWKAGLPVKVDTALEGEDGVKTIIEPFDPNREAPAKPSHQAPKLPNDEERGPIRTFHIPAKLSVFIEKALKAMDWATFLTEDAVILCEKFGIEAKEEEKEEAEETEEEPKEE